MGDLAATDSRHVLALLEGILRVTGDKRGVSFLGQELVDTMHSGLSRAADVS